MMKNRSYIALGSNITPRFYYLQEAEKNLASCDQIKVTNRSQIYETLPVGFMDQGQFLNMVIEVETNFTPTELLAYCQEVELSLGRKREIRWGPRTIDLDILLYNHENMETEQLILPHPSMRERAFVMVPLADVNPDIEIPGLEKKVSEVLTELPAEEKRGVVKWIAPVGEEE